MLRLALLTALCASPALAEPRLFDVKVAKLSSTPEAEVFTWDGDTVSLPTLGKQGFEKVPVTKTEKNGQLRLDLAASGTPLVSFHAVIRKDGSIEGKFAVRDEKRNLAWQFRGTPRK